MNERLVNLKNDLDICIAGNCSECKYWTRHCTDSLIDECAKVIGDLLNDIKREN